MNRSFKTTEEGCDGAMTAQSAVRDIKGLQISSGRRFHSTDATEARGLNTAGRRVSRSLQELLSRKPSKDQQVLKAEEPSGGGADDLNGAMNFEGHCWRTADTLLMNSAPRFNGRLHPIWDGTHLRARYIETNRRSFAPPSDGLVNDVYVFHSRNTFLFACFTFPG